MDLIGQRIVEEKLRSELIVLTFGVPGANRKVDVDRPARVPTGVDRLELNSTVCISELIATKEILPRAARSPIRNARILALRVTMPDIHLRALDGRTTVIGNAGDVDVEGERDAFLYGIIRGVRTNV